MGTRLEEMDDDIAALAKLTSDVRAVGLRLLAYADQSRPGEKAFHARLTNAVAQASLLGRTQHGLLVQLLARAQEHRAIPGGAPAWLAATQGVSNGHARTLVNDAKHLTVDPEIAEHLTEGSLSPDATRVLARTVKALADTDGNTQRQAVAEVLSEMQTKGVTQAAKLIPKLEKKASPCKANEILAAQRARSYARVVELDDGAHRYHVLLDAERSTHVNTALETYAAHVYRCRQSGDVEVLPADVHTTEQIAAHAFTRLAETFLNTNGDVHGAVLKMPATLAGSRETTNHLVETVHSRTRPAGTLHNFDEPQPEVIQLDTDADPSTLNDEPAAGRGLRRLTARLQRPGFAYQGRPCTSPGCTRSAAWPLHTHYAKRFRSGSLTELKNLIFYCPDHHAAIHQTG